MQIMTIVPRKLMLVLIISAAIFFMSTIRQIMKQIPEEPQKHIEMFESKWPQKYLVSSPTCKIIDLDPNSEEFSNFFKKLKYEPCTNKQPLTEIVQNFANDSVIIKIHKNFKRKNLKCCYREIFRSGSLDNADGTYRLSDCKYFSDDLILPASMEFIIVECYNLSDEISMRFSETIYTNAHALIRRKKIKLNVETKKPISVLMFGIDSVSRMNLWRAMPETAKHLQDTGWFELQGYNKVADNTFPNVMAVMTGQNESLTEKICNPNDPGKLDSCQFIWKDFKQNGYVTAYAEDEAGLNTFNLNKVGFEYPPTDHYFRPFALAAEENLENERRDDLRICLGYQNYVDHVFQYAIDFAKIYKNQPHFGLFWTCTFSHNDLSDASMMDLKIKSYFNRLNEEGILNSSIVVFFSDHGMRSGKLRPYMAGWLEERLPFVFIWLPEWFKQEHPGIVKNLRTNKNRLTTPFDLHMTLKHILKISGAKTNFAPAASCPNCQSLFKPIPLNRSCEDAGIERHWCTCRSFKNLRKANEVVRSAVKFVIDNINFKLKELIASNDCIPLELEKIIAARQSIAGSFTEYLVVFQTMKSHGLFEGTVRHFTDTNKFKMMGPVSRINGYGGQSRCTGDFNLKGLCYCREYHLAHSN